MRDDELLIIARRKNVNLVAIERLKRIEAMNEKYIEKFKAKGSIVVVNN